MPLEFAILGMILTSILGFYVKSIWDFLKKVEEKDDRDDLIEKLQRTATSLQSVLENIKTKMRDVEQRYLDTREDLTELQIKYDRTVIQLEQSRKQQK